MTRKQIEVCLTPATYDTFKNDEAIVVVVDILRATSAICTAFMNGARKIIPVATLEEAREYKVRGSMVAAERDGIVRDFADFGNSPYNFTPERVKGNDIVYSTTNGTNTIMMASHSFQVLIGSYLNHQALVDHIARENRDLVILCAGWKNKFNLEDTLFAGALAKSLLENDKFETVCDSTYASIDLWELASVNLMQYLEKVAQRHRLKKNKLDDVLEYCHTFNLTGIIPYLEKDYLVPMGSA
ncbi:MAG: 2-phosphosulfolactate phosphatase [Bacteroidales bacterium]|nr:2-phosphosulfolactate phosphatase [Bacteroidales bacterium]